MKYDFSGYATKSGIKCKDGRTILKGAFQHQNGQQVPLVWQHGHDDIKNVIGHCLLESRDDGMYTYGSLNGTERGNAAKEQLKHGDLNALSIFAGNLTETNGFVAHGDILEVSLCIGGANSGAVIDNIEIAHSDGTSYISEDEVIMHFNAGIVLEAGDTEDPDGTTLSHSGDGEKSIESVINSMNDEQQAVFYGMVAEIMKKNSMEHSRTGGKMKKNLFDSTHTTARKPGTITHDQFATIEKEARECGSWKKAFLAHANEYGIGNIEYLFPDYKSETSTPEFLKRDTEWVAGVLAAVKRLPFTRIKSLYADITVETARAKGYIKGNLKKEEFFSLAKRETGPVSVYKKQKLDRDDILDATTIDVVNWLWAEMRLMLNEEIARAILIGDGREVDDPDHIPETGLQCIRSVWKDDELYTMHKVVDTTSAEAEIDALIEIMGDYEGSGTPTMYVPKKKITAWKLIKDNNGRRIYESTQQIADLIGVKKIEEVEVMNGVTRTTDSSEKRSLQALIVNLNDYAVGTDKGGEISRFDQFDIDYNQYKYLLETRISGTLRKIRSAIAIERVVS